MFNNSPTSSHRLCNSCMEFSFKSLLSYFFCAMLCSFLQSSCRLFNCCQFSSFAVAAIHSCCHVIDLKFTLVRILLYISLLDVTYSFSLWRNVQLSRSSEDSKTVSEKRSPFFPSNLLLIKHEFSNDGVFQIVTTTLMNQYCNIKVQCFLCKAWSNVGDLKYRSEHSLAEQYTKLSHQLQTPASLSPKRKPAIVIENPCVFVCLCVCVLHSRLVPLRWWRNLLAL